MMMMMMNSGSSGGVDHGSDAHGMASLLAGQPGPPPMASGMSQMEVLRKGPWMPEEDEILVEYVKQYGPRDWSSIRAKGLLPRTGKSCRLRWVNKLKPDLKSGCKFSPEEEKLVVEMQAKLGNKWAKIASYLPGRTDNDVKNFWSTRQKRLLRALQRPKDSDSTSPSMHSSMHMGNLNGMDPSCLDHLNKAHCFNEFASFQVHSPTGGMMHHNSSFGHGFFGEDDDTDLFIRGQPIRSNPGGTNYNNMPSQLPNHQIQLGPMGGIDDVFMVKLQDLVPNESVASFMAEASSSLIDNGCMSGSSSLNNQNCVLGMQDGATSTMALLGSETTAFTITPTPSTRINNIVHPKASRTVKNTRRPRSRRAENPSNANDNYRATLLDAAMAQISENADLKLLQLDETMAQLQQQVLQPLDLDVTHNPLDDNDFKPHINICSIISGMPPQVGDLYIDAHSDPSHNNYLAEFMMQYDSCCTTTSTSPTRASSPGFNGLCCSPDLDNDVRWDKLPGLLYPCMDEPPRALQPEDMACSTLSMNIKEEIMDTKSCTPDSVLASFPSDVFDSLEPLSPSSSDWWQS